MKEDIITLFSKVYVVKEIKIARNSTRYDNKDAMNLVTESNQAIAIHGCEGTRALLMLVER